MVEPIEVSLLQFACYLAHGHYNKEKTSEIAEMRKTNQGSKWIRKSTRLAIYYRDGFCCVYCGAAGESSGVGLTLDHIAAQELGGSSDPSNLVTACLSCNSAKQHLTMRGWLKRMRSKGINTERVARRIRALVSKKLNRVEGRRLERIRSARKA